MDAPAGRPESETYSIQDLVALVLRGEVRIPAFQGELRWTPDDVLDLLDSVHRGFPIGTLLLWKRPAEAAGLELGPVHVDASAHASALWVVDGQQRLTSLVAVLMCPERVRPEHRLFEVFFDLRPEPPSAGPRPRSRRFVRRPDGGPMPETWLPMRVIVRPETLDGWIDAHLSDKELRRQARSMGTAFRERAVPACVVSTTDEGEVRTIFERTNRVGRRFSTDEVFAALGATRETPADLRALEEALKPLRFGAIGPRWLLGTLFALRGEEVTPLHLRRFRELRASESRSALSDTERALGRAIVFLRRDADVPHVSLLPYRLPLVVLARFFHLFPEPRPRSRALLARWVWAGAASGEHASGRRPLVREALRAVRAEESGAPQDEEESVQRLLAMVSWTPPWKNGLPELGPLRFGTPESRVHLAALASLRPRSLDDGAPLDVGPLLAEHREAALPRIMTVRAGDADGWTGEEARLSDHLANRLIHPPLGNGAPLLQRLHGADDATLRSHGFDEGSVAALRAGDGKSMLALRDAFLRAHVQRHIDRHARWIESRRKSLGAILGRDLGKPS
jgi:hypothetical protein